MNEQTEFSPVFVCTADEYDRARLFDLLCQAAEKLGIEAEHFIGKKVVIKPNLVAPMKPEEAATTHPIFLGAVIDFLQKYGARDITLAESPGGVFSESTLRHAYKVGGLDTVCTESGVTLNFDTSASGVSAPGALRCHAFNILTAIQQADVIIDLCKLKTHSLTGMSAAVKNFFGVIPGVEKFEMHAGYPNAADFAEMMCDLCEFLCTQHEVWAICDGIVAMEGNGPTGGNPKAANVVLMSHSPFVLDSIAAKIIGISGDLPLLETSVRRGYCPQNVESIPIIGESLEEIGTRKFKPAGGTYLTGTILRELPNIFGGRFAEAFSPKPVVDKKKCVGCGVCVKSCPKKTIVLAEKNGKKQAKIQRENCIHCFCCQELCPIHAINIYKNPLITILSGK